MLIGFVAAYLLITLLIGWWASRKVHSAQDFAVAGRNLPFFVSASGLFATWFGSETVLGASSEFVEKGVLGIIEDPFGASLCLLLIGLFFARPLYRLNITTFCDYFRLRFGKKSEYFSAFLIIPSYFGWIAAQLVALAIILHSLVGLPIVWGIGVCLIIVVLYTFVGGMWAVAVTDTVQTVMIVVGLAAIAFYLWNKVGGLDVVLASTSDDFFNFLPKSNVKDVSKYITAWITIGLGSIPQQDVFQRVTASKSENTAVWASFAGSLMYFFIACLPLVIALCGKIIAPELVHQHSGDTQLFLPTVILQYSPLFLQILFFGALLSAILSTASGAMLAPATILGENIVRPLIPHISDAKLLASMRWSVLGVALCSGVMALSNSNIFELVGEASELSLVSLFIPLLAGLYWKRANSVGSIASMLVGTLVWFWGQFQDWEIPSLLWGTLASSLAMVLGSLLTKPEAVSEEMEAVLAFQKQKS